MPFFLVTCIARPDEIIERRRSSLLDGDDVVERAIPKTSFPTAIIASARMAGEDDGAKGRHPL